MILNFLGGLKEGAASGIFLGTGIYKERPLSRSRLNILIFVGEVRRCSSSRGSLGVIRGSGLCI